MFSGTCSLGRAINPRGDIVASMLCYDSWTLPNYQHKNLYWNFPKFSLTIFRSVYISFLNIPYSSLIVLIHSFESSYVLHNIVLWLISFLYIYAIACPVLVLNFSASSSTDHSLDVSPPQKQ